VRVDYLAGTITDRMATDSAATQGKWGAAAASGLVPFV